MLFGYIFINRIQPFEAANISAAFFLCRPLMNHNSCHRFLNKFQNEISCAPAMYSDMWDYYFQKIKFCKMQIFENQSIPWGHVRSHKKILPDRFSRFDVYWIETNRQTDKPNLYIEENMFTIKIEDGREPSIFILCLSVFVCVQ